MNRFKDYIYNLIKLWVPGNEEVAAKDEEDVAVHPSTSVKRFVFQFFNVQLSSILPSSYFIFYVFEF